MVPDSDQQVSTAEPPELEVTKVSDDKLSGLARMSTFRALAYREFSFLWYAQLANSATLWLEMVARPIVVLDLTNSPVHLGLILATRMFPQLVFGLVAGVVADWFNRRTVLLMSQVAGMVLDFILAFLLLAGVAEVWHIYVTSFFKGVAMSFDQPARQSLVPSLVPKDSLANAVALNTASMQFMRIAGAFLAGVLLATVGAGPTFLIIAIISACAVVSILQMRPVLVDVVVKDKGGKAAADSFMEGLRFAWDTRPIRELLLLQMSYFMLAMSYMQVFAPLLARQVMGIGDAGFGFLMSTAGAGALVGALVVATLSPSRHRGKAMIVIVAAMGTFLSLFAASTYLPYVVLSFALIALVGVAQTLFIAIGNTVLLQTTPAEKRGRIMSLLSMDRAMTTLGGAVAGFLAAAIGSQLAQITYGVVLVLLAIVAALNFASLRKTQ